MMPPEEPIDAERIRALPREIPPPPELEGRVLGELRRRKLVLDPVARPATSRGHRALRFRWAASLMAVFLAGWLAGRTTAPSPTATERAAGSPFLLLLYEPRPLHGGTFPELVTEYRVWARKMAQEGRLIDVERLDRLERRVVPAGFASHPQGLAPQRAPVPFGAPYGGPTGYFLLLAKDLAEAEELARQCPHIAHGGEIAVHPVDRRPVGTES